MLVDDEENILRALTRLLRRDGYRIHTAYSATEGLRVLGEQPDIGVVISDQRMPGMLGSEFLGIVKQRFPRTIRIMLSGYTELESVTQAMCEGAIYKFLTKPWDDDALRAEVKAAFTEHRAGDDPAKPGAEGVRRREGIPTGGPAGAPPNASAAEDQALARAVLAHLPVAVLGMANDGAITIANERAHQLLGVVGRLPGRRIAEVLPAEWLVLLARIDTGGQHVQRGMRLNGRRITVHCGRLGDRADGRLLVLAPEEEP